MTVQCAWCGRTKTEDGWKKRDVEADEIISHGMCEACTRKMLGNKIKTGGTDNAVGN